MKKDSNKRRAPSTRKGGPTGGASKKRATISHASLKPREPVDLPTAIKFGTIGIVAIALGAFLARVVINERRLNAGLELNPTVLETEVSAEPISEEQIINHCEDAEPDALCRLGLPAIDIPSMKLVTLGTTKRNGRTQIAVPDSIYIAGWFNGSARPDERGITFISAHSSAARHAPFNRLNEMQSGDEITIERGDGRIFRYHVVSSSRLSLDDANLWVRDNLGTRANANSNQHILYIMTCIGAWNLNQNTMNERLLVRAHLVE